MQIKLNDIFSLGSDRYITLEETNYNGNRYIFTNKLDDDENPTKDFVVFMCTSQGLIKEKKEENLKPLLNYFSELANDRLELVNETLYGVGENNG